MRVANISVLFHVLNMAEGGTQRHATKEDSAIETGKLLDEIARTIVDARPEVIAALINQAAISHCKRGGFSAAQVKRGLTVPAIT